VFCAKGALERIHEGLFDKFAEVIVGALPEFARAGVSFLRQVKNGLLVNFYEKGAEGQCHVDVDTNPQNARSDLMMNIVFTIQAGDEKFVTWKWKVCRCVYVYMYVFVCVRLNVCVCVFGVFMCLCLCTQKGLKDAFTSSGVPSEYDDCRTEIVTKKGEFVIIRGNVLHKVERTTSERVTVTVPFCSNYQFEKSGGVL
jgi:hypothetical protein